MLTIRAAEAAEEAEIVALWRACGLVTTYNDPAADFQFALGRESSDVLVGFSEDGEVTGTVLVGHDGHRGWLYYVATAPEAQHLGIGRQMVQAAEEWLRKRGVPKVQLMVRESNTGVLAFYERLGFEVTPRVVMAKWLVG